MMNSDYENLRPIFQRNIFLLRILGILLIIFAPIIIILGGPIFLWKEYKELISDAIYEIKTALTIKKP